jgi:hypothetical protein
VIDLRLRTKKSFGDAHVDRRTNPCSLGQIAGVFAELAKHRLVSKLKSARDRKRATGVKVEGRKALAETNPDAVKLAKRLRRASPKTGDRLSSHLKAAVDGVYQTIV